MKVILPNQLVEIDLSYGPLFFLAGPIAGGGDWQKNCYEEIRRHIEKFFVAIPCRYKENHPLRKFEEKGRGETFERQLVWERHYLNVAARVGCIIFWLPVESKTTPRKDGLPYAMDTRGEIGEWRGRMMHNREIRLVMGAEAGFPGLSQIKRNFNGALCSEFPIYQTLRETVKRAVEKAQ